VPVPNLLRGQHLYLLPEHLGTAVAEHLLGLLVDDGNLAQVIDDHHRIRRRLEHVAEISLRRVVAGHIHHRARDVALPARLDRGQRDPRIERATVFSQALEPETGDERPGLLLVVLPVVALRHEHVYRFSVQLAGPVAEQGFCLGTCRDDFARRISDDDGVLRSLDALEGFLDLCVHWQCFQ